jgi:hypothetical protein
LPTTYSAARSTAAIERCSSLISLIAVNLILHLQITARGSARAYHSTDRKGPRGYQQACSVPGAFNGVLDPRSSNVSSTDIVILSSRGSRFLDRHQIRAIRQRVERPMEFAGPSRRSTAHRGAERQILRARYRAQDSALRILYDGAVEGRIMSTNGRPGYRKNPDHRTRCR